MCSVALLSPTKGGLNATSWHVDAVTDDKMITDAVPPVVRHVIAINHLRIATAACAVVQDDETPGMDGG